jgi:hypothetical protein
MNLEGGQTSLDASLCNPKKVMESRRDGAGKKIVFTSWGSFRDIHPFMAVAFCFKTDRRGPYPPGSGSLAPAG